jgi:hypothetical protein
VIFRLLAGSAPALEHGVLSATLSASPMSVRFHIDTKSRN